MSDLLCWVLHAVPNDHKWRWFAVWLLFFFFLIVVIAITIILLYIVCKYATMVMIYKYYQVKSYDQNSCNTLVFQQLWGEFALWGHRLPTSWRQGGWGSSLVTLFWNAQNSDLGGCISNIDMTRLGLSLNFWCTAKFIRQGEAWSLSRDHSDADAGTDDTVLVPGSLVSGALDLWRTFPVYHSNLTICQLFLIER